MKFKQFYRLIKTKKQRFITNKLKLKIINKTKNYKKQTAYHILKLKIFKKLFNMKKKNKKLI